MIRELDRRALVDGCVVQASSPLVDVRAVLEQKPKPWKRGRGGVTQRKDQCGQKCLVCVNLTRARELVFCASILLVLLPRSVRKK